MNRSLWSASPLTGTFSTSENGLGCTLTLELHPGGRLAGRLLLGDLAFEIRGKLSHRPNIAYGFVLDPSSAVPLALLRASASAEAITLELDIPEPDDREALDDPARRALACLWRGTWTRA